MAVHETTYHECRLCDQDFAVPEDAIDHLITYHQVTTSLAEHVNVSIYYGP